MIFHHPGVRLLGLYLEVAIDTAGWWFGTFGLWFHILGIIRCTRRCVHLHGQQEPDSLKHGKLQKLGIILPADFHIFQRGRYTTN